MQTLRVILSALLLLAMPASGMAAVDGGCGHHGGVVQQANDAHAGCGEAAQESNTDEPDCRCVAPSCSGSTMPALAHLPACPVSFRAAHPGHDRVTAPLPSGFPQLPLRPPTSS